MIPDFHARLRDAAEVMVRVGLNLQPGQPLLIAEPYEQQGVAPSAEVLVAAVRAAAAPCTDRVEVQWCDPAEVRQLAEAEDASSLDARLARNVRRMESHVAAGGALLFLGGSLPRLLTGLSPERRAAYHARVWRHLGPLVQRLVGGATQWTCAPAPSPTWATLAFADAPSESRLALLWHTVFAALRADGSGGAVEAWQAHLASLEARAAGLDTRRCREVRFLADGTDLRLGLDSGHRWRTARLRSAAGLPFVVNLPTEEVFTAPDRRRAEGRLRVARPVVFAGDVLDGIELEFRSGEVIAASARAGGEVLTRLLETDEGARRLGEVALVGGDLGADSPDWTRARRVFHQLLLDENASHHVALGEAYPFCHAGWWKASVNRSQLHLDLPLDARVELA
jgi:aminopeptidase